MKTKSLCFSRNNHNRLYILVCALALFLGGMIYILFRTIEPVFFHWVRVAGFERWLNFARSKSLSLSPALPEWIVFSLPGGLWAFAYALVITVIWKGSKSRLKYFWMASIPLLVIGFEILQYAGIIPGTFSLQDIALGISGLIIGILTGIKTTKPSQHEKVFE
jgi:hypothetical protein